MIAVLLRPWRRAETLWSLAHALLDPLMGALTFSAVFSLLVAAIVLLVVFPLAIPVIWLLFAVATLLGRLESALAWPCLGSSWRVPIPHSGTGRGGRG